MIQRETGSFKYRIEIEMSFHWTRIINKTLTPHIMGSRCQVLDVLKTSFTAYAESGHRCERF